MLGLKIDLPSKTLSATSNSGDGASLRHYNLASGVFIGNYPLPGAHVFNDLVVSSRHEVFVTDTKEGSVYKLSPTDKYLRRLAPKHVFKAANGIALFSDERSVLVSTFGDGSTVVDLASAHRGSLIAIQNDSFSLPIAAPSRQWRSSKRRNPMFDGLTTGTPVANRFYYIANTKIDKKDVAKMRLNPLQILTIDLDVLDSGTSSLYNPK